MTDIAGLTGIEYSVDGGVAHVRLNRPEVSNSIDLPTAQALVTAVRQAAADDAVRAVLLTGAGPRFCAGGDVASMVAAGDGLTDYLLELATTLDQAMQDLTALAKPVVGAVQGAVAGAGLAVMLSADVVIAAEGTKFVTAYAGIGATPDVGLSYLLPRAIGQQRALEFSLTGRVLTSEEALAWGLVNQIAPADEAYDVAAALAARLATGPAQALGQAKRLMREGWTRSRAEVGADEAKTIAEAVSSDEARPLLAKFAK